MFLNVAAAQHPTSPAGPRGGPACAADSAGELRPAPSPHEYPPGPDAYAGPGGAVGFAAPPAGLRPDQGGQWVRILGSDYARFGPPRPISVQRVRSGELLRVGEVQGVTVFVPFEAGADLRTAPEVLYVLTPACFFQPYVSREGARAGPVSHR